jgi:hypothetical protein
MASFLRTLLQLRYISIKRKNLWFIKKKAKSFAKGVFKCGFRTKAYKDGYIASLLAS